MASISLPLQSQDTVPHQSSDSSESRAYGSSRRRSQISAPAPNPHFVFPASDPDETRSETQPMARTPTRTPPPLPPFSFNPGAGHSSSPSSPSALGAPRTTAHRRQLSELIGSEREGEAGSAATDSTQGPNDSLFPAPAKLPVPGPGFSAPSRRFHAHRRSAAISSVDLTMISKGLDLSSTAGSAPSTPATMRQQRTANDEVVRPMSYSETSLSLPPQPASSFLFPDNSSQPREKSGLYDGPFYHRRPLSTISSETSGSLQATQAEPVADTTKSAASNVRTGPAQFPPRIRPKTAGAPASLASDAHGTTSPDAQVPRPCSASAHPQHSATDMPNNTFLGHDLHAGEHLGRSSSEDDDSDRSFEIDRDTLEPSPSASKQRSCGSKKRRKKAKVRSWAGALLIRGKSKTSEEEGNGGREQTAVEPPILTRTNSDLGSGLDVNFDDDEIVVLRSPSSTNVSEIASLAVDTSSSPSLESSWKPRSFYEQTTQADTFSPVIDLDAALGPFNTPEMTPSRVVGGGFSAARERMYSGGRRGEFVGPEMRYHRRAESAPEMPPVDRSFLGFSRLGPSAALVTAEVFDEEEEDAFLAAGNDGAAAAAAASPIKPSTQSIEGAPQTEDTQSLSGPDDADTITPVASSSDQQTQGLGIQQCLPGDQTPMQQANAAIASEDLTQVEQPLAVDTQEQSLAVDPSCSPVASRPSQRERWGPAPAPRPFAASSPNVSPRFVAADKRPSTSPVKLPPHMPMLTLQAGSPNPNSTFPSPDLCGSSVGGARSITTPSTIDRNFSNLSYSTDPSLDQPPASFEDIPSLTSSASTMTTTMHRISATFFRQRGSGERSASFSHHGPRRISQGNTSKRSSLASLSKLMVNPHAEKSKLSLVETPPDDEPGKAKKQGRRLSRLIHFWRPKDRDRMSDGHEQSRESD